MTGSIPNRAINHLAALLAFALPLNRPAMSILTGLIILLWLAGGEYRGKIQALARCPLVIAALLFVTLNLVSLAWSGHRPDGQAYLNKYWYFLLLPAIATSLQAEGRRRVTTAFLWGVSISLVFSFAIYLGLLPLSRGSTVDPSPFVRHMDYSILLAFAALLVFLELDTPRRNARRRKLLEGLFLFLIAGLFVNIGRSGQLAFFGTLLVLLPLQMKGSPRRRAAAALLLVLLGFSLAYGLSSTFQGRINGAAADLRKAVLGEAYDTNQGKRVAATIVALEIIGRHPFIGTGLGGNMPVFRELLDERYPRFRRALGGYVHLHSQYLQVLTELGFLGLASLLAIFYFLLRPGLRGARAPGPVPARSASAPRIAAAANGERIALVLASVYLLGFLAEPFLHKQVTLVLFTLFAGLTASREIGPDREQRG